MNRLPEELPIGRGETHDVALVAGDVGVPLALVVRADKHPAIGNAWIAIALRTQRGGPLDVFPAGDIPGGRNARSEAVDHIPGRLPSPHGPAFGNLGVFL